MEFSETLFKRRIAGGLPASANRRASPGGEGSGPGPAAGGAIDLRDLPHVRDDEEFVREAYRRILGRECDISGFVGYLETLRRRTPRRVVIMDLVNSEEAKARGVRFAGISEPPLAPGRRRIPLPSLNRVARGLAGRAYEVVRRVWYAPFSSVDHKLSLVLRELAVREDRLSAKTDEALWTLSEKLDSYVASLQERQREIGDAVDAQRVRLGELRADIAASEAQSARIGQALTALGDVQTQLAKGQERFESLMDENRRQLANGSESLREQLDALQRSISDARRRAEVTLAETRDSIRSPILHAGNNLLATEVDGFILGIPGEEWRLAAYYAFRGNPEPGATRRFRALVKPGAVVVDVGANLGLYTLHAARLLGGEGKIHSFEPTPRTFQILKDNVQVNGFLETATIELHQEAVTDRIGSAELAVYSDDCGHNTLFFDRDDGKSHSIAVRTVSLDEALRAEPRIDVAKIDAEGAEPFILRGMRQIVARSPAIRILMEFAPSHLRRAGADPGDFLQEISSAGFEIRRIHDETGELTEVSRYDLVGVFSANLELVRDPSLSGGGLE